MFENVFFDAGFDLRVFDGYYNHFSHFGVVVDCVSDNF
jgi:hypothetical protein